MGFNSGFKGLKEDTISNIENYNLSHSNSKQGTKVAGAMEEIE